LLLASKSAGNTGLRNEIVSICNELLSQKVTSKPLYKKRINNQRLKKRYVFGGSSILDSILKFIVKTFTSQGAKALASSAAKEIGGKAAVDAGK